MYALINKLNDKVLHVDVRISNDGYMTYHASDDGELPLIHFTRVHMVQMIDGNYPDYENSYEYPSLDEIDIEDYEIRELYISQESIATI